MNKISAFDARQHIVTLWSLAAVVVGGSVPASAQEHTMNKLIDFQTPEQADWTIVNDGVMGGRSSSSLELTGEGTAAFSGTLSLENNGGFASTRALFENLDLSEYSGLRLRVKGDGRRYQVRIRTDGYYDGVAYRSDFSTEPGEWTEVSLPFSSFQPTFRGRTLGNAPPLDPSSIRQIGFLLGDKIEGPFRLEIAWISAFQSEQ
jgi:monofunctional biosynthetic peptidoglycan transglycosylase